MKIPVLAAAALVLGIAGAQGAPKSLFTRLGGKPKIATATRDFLGILAKDQRLLSNPKLSELSGKVDRKKLSAELAERICSVSGGPCKMKPGMLESVGARLNLSVKEWIYIIQDLNQTLEKHRVPKADQAEFLTLILKAREGATAAANP